MESSRGRAVLLQSAPTSHFCAISYSNVILKREHGANKQNAFCFRGLHSVEYKNDRILDCCYHLIMACSGNVPMLVIINSYFFAVTNFITSQSPFGVPAITPGPSISFQQRNVIV